MVTAGYRHTIEREMELFYLAFEEPFPFFPGGESSSLAVMGSVEVDAPVFFAFFVAPRVRFVGIGVDGPASALPVVVSVGTGSMLRGTTACGEELKWC